MSAKLDQSLDDIVSTKRVARRGRGRGRSGRRVVSSRVKAVAPVGGIRKTAKTTKGAVVSAIPTGPASGNAGESKIIVSNLVGSVEYHGHLHIRLPMP